jgi:hypothetical protein
MTEYSIIRDATAPMPIGACPVRTDDRPCDGRAEGLLSRDGIVVAAVCSRHGEALAKKGYDWRPCGGPSYELHVCCDLWTVSRERSAHWAVRDELVAQARGAGKVTALQALQEGRLVRFGHQRVVIEVTPYQCRGNLADPGNHYPPAKAVVDGLRDAGVLDDDTGEYVAEVKMLAPVKTPARMNGLRLVITPAQDAPHQ